jgi:hypothetical protein
MKIVSVDIKENSQLNGKDVSALEYWIKNEEYFLDVPCPKSKILEIVETKYTSDLTILNSKILSARPNKAKTVFYFGYSYRRPIYSDRSFIFLAHDTHFLSIKEFNGFNLLSEYPRQDSFLYRKKIAFENFIAPTSFKDCCFLSISSRKNIEGIDFSFIRDIEKPILLYFNKYTQLQKVVELKKVYKNLIPLSGVINNLHGEFNELIYLKEDFTFDYSPRLILESRFFNKKITVVNQRTKNIEDGADRNLFTPLHEFFFDKMELDRINSFYNM